MTRLAGVVGLGAWLALLASMACARHSAFDVEIAPSDGVETVERVDARDASGDPRAPDADVSGLVDQVEEGATDERGTGADGNSEASDVPTVDACQSTCKGRECGDDGCGGSCGACPATDSCRSRCQDGACLPAIPVELRCDGLDEDCDGEVDDEFAVFDPATASLVPVGGPCDAEACAGGLVVCTADGGAATCSVATPLGGEVCDGLDNDCDGLIDADDAADLSVGDPAFCELQAGVCAGARKPPDLCRLGKWEACEVPQYLAWNPEWEAVETRCDGLDNDCDGVTDGDGLPAGVGPPCENQLGVCAGSSKPPKLCQHGVWHLCSLTDYAGQGGGFTAGVDAGCDRLDSDCDGRTDEDFAGAPCWRTSPSATCAGVEVCHAGQVVCDAPEPGPDEACDGIDDDCDGLTDEDCPHCAGDFDCDGAPDDADDCPAIANADQLDLDQDGLGDACDPDQDGDGVARTAGDCDDRDAAVFPGASDAVAGTCALWSPVWTSTVIKSGADPALEPSITLAPSGAVWISARRSSGSAIFLASNASGAWASVSISATAKPGPALAIDRHGYVHLSYASSSTYGGIYYATNRSGVWAHQWIGSSYSGTRDTALAVDHQGFAHVVTTTTTGNAFSYATNRTTGWVAQAISAGGSGRDPSLVLDAAGHLHAAFLHDAAGAFTVEYATDTSGVWTVEPFALITPSATSTTAVGVAADGPALVAFSNPANGGLFLARIAEAGAVVETVATYGASGGYAALAVGAGGVRHVFYRDCCDGPDGLWYASDATGGWAATAITSDGSGIEPAAAIDALGHLHVVHRRGDGALVYTTSHVCVVAGDAADTNCDGADGVDADGDGHASLASGGDDCDDGDAGAFPGNPTDLVDGVDPSTGLGTDNDCDGVDGVDRDGDGQASVASGGDDCDDTDRLRFPGMFDTCQTALDRNCDGAPGIDADGDGFGDAKNPPGSGCTDCDDGDVAVHPGAWDQAGDGFDTNCDGVDGIDADRDGHASAASGGDDCNDAIASVYPGALEVCDSVDNDCDGQIDLEPCSDGNACTLDDTCHASACVGTPVAIDDGIICTLDRCNKASGAVTHTALSTFCLLPVDGVPTCIPDAAHEPGEPCWGCEPAVNQGDWSPLADGHPCDDGDPTTVWDACAQQVCAGLSDGDADGVPDVVDDCPTIWNPDQADLDQDASGDVCDADADGDGAAAAASGGDDCDDRDATVRPGATEHCDGVDPSTGLGKDDDCDGLVDAADPSLERVPCERQAGVCAGATKRAYFCVGGSWQACDDAIYAGIAVAYEAGDEQTCDGQDNDCDGETDEPFKLGEVYGLDAHCGSCANDCTTFTVPGADGAICSAERTPPACVPVCSNGFADLNHVPDDGCECVIVDPLDPVDPLGFDANCDGIDGVDSDGDGYASRETGGDDCDDADPWVHPGAADRVGDSCASYTDPWAAVVVDAAGSVGRYASLVATSAGELVVAYQDASLHRLKVAWRVGAAWSSALVPGGEGALYTTAAVAPNGDVHVAWFDEDAADLEIARRSGGQWASEPIATAGAVGGFLSLAFGPDGTPWVSAYDFTNEQLAVFWNGGTGWTRETVASGMYVGTWTSIAVGADGMVHVAHHDQGTGELKYSRRDLLGAWTTQVIDSDPQVGLYASLRLFPDGAVVIAYHDAYHDRLKLARQSGSQWLRTVIDEDGSTGSHLSLAVSANGVLHVAYHDVGKKDLRYATDGSGAWVATTLLAEGSVGTWASMALDPSGGIHVACFDRTNEDLLVISEHACAALAITPDTNCDGLDGLDLDGDGYASRESGGDDCDDTQAAVHPDAVDVAGDGQDTDCDGSD